MRIVQIGTLLEEHGHGVPEIEKTDFVMRQRSERLLRRSEPLGGVFYACPTPCMFGLRQNKQQNKARGP